MTMKKIINSEALYVIKKTASMDLFPVGFEYLLGGVTYKVTMVISKDNSSNMRRLVSSAGDVEDVSVETIEKDLQDKSTVIIFDPSKEVPVKTGDSYSGGLGTEESPYQISAVPDWQQLMKNTTDWDKFFIMTADINLDLKVVDVTSIGNENNKFIGTFNGNNHNVCYKGRGVLFNVGEGGHLLNLFMNLNNTKPEQLPNNNSQDIPSKKKKKVYPKAEKVVPRNKIGRNVLCPCGSGKKFKKCHG